MTTQLQPKIFWPRASVNLLVWTPPHSPIEPPPESAMGASGSKTAQNAVRKFPVRAPGSSPAAVQAPSAAATSNPQPVATPAAGGKPRARPQASYTKDDGMFLETC